MQNVIEKCTVVTPWHNAEQLSDFLRAWNTTVDNPQLVLQHDAKGEGCGVTKNKGIREAMQRGAEVVVVLDDDCYPSKTTPTLFSLMQQHCNALYHQPVPMFETVTDPPSRGTPYDCTDMVMPVAASMGFWEHVGDYCAVRQLAFNSFPMEHYPQIIFGKYFPLCGMNLAFRPSLWLPWCTFIDVPRFDDIWMGWLWQREAYRRRYCFNLKGPVVTHSRQSNVWKNLIDEATHLEANDSLWRQIALATKDQYSDLIQLLPTHVNNN